MAPIKEYFNIAVKNLRTRRLRTWLTIVGVLIGVFLIMSLVSLSEGIKLAVLKELRMMGKDTVMVFPGEITNIAAAFGGGLTLSEDDLQAIKKSQGVDVILAMNWKAEGMRYEGTKKTILLAGEPWREALDILKTDLGWSLQEGQWPIPGKNEILVGNLVPTDIFPGMRVGTSASIGGRQFTIVGILKSVGSKQDDSMVIMDLDIFRQITGERKGAKFVYAKIMPGFSVDQAVEHIKENLDETRKRKKGEDLPSFTVITSEKVTEIAGNIIGLIQAAIFGFASIAIVVGGIGIMNTMYTSVYERINEIGIMKAVGAKSSTVISIFLIESGILGLVGGIGGVALGLGFAKIIEFYFQFHPILYLRAAITPSLVIFGLVFSFLVGCFSGFFPARKASKMNPVEALRYE